MCTYIKTILPVTSTCIPYMVLFKDKQCLTQQARAVEVVGLKGQTNVVLAYLWGTLGSLHNPP